MLGASFIGENFCPSSGIVTSKSLCRRHPPFPIQVKIAYIMAVHSHRVLCMLVLCFCLSSATADPVADTRAQASELEALRSDISALKPRVSAGALTLQPVVLVRGRCSINCLWFAQVAARRGQFCPIHTRQGPGHRRLRIWPSSF